ncbi:CHAP domain-containing protein, partial [Nocardioides sp. YIM 152588]|uniref:CHAP domain-containing protein n=1 Tax=Nocardioides sp. YIM 152588 TaxID=3158259 RepID=UPI0032E53119
MVVAGLLMLSAVAPAAQAAPSGWACYSLGDQACVSDYGYAGQTTWGYEVDDHGNNCTTYVAFRLSQRGVENPGNLGNAIDWDENARVAGLSVSPVPSVGAVAQWNTGTYGHVAYVDWVSTDGTQIAVSETGYGVPGIPSMSGRSVLNKSGSGHSGPDASAGWPDNFIHFGGEQARPLVIARITKKNVLWAKTNLDGKWKKLKHNVAEASVATDSVNGLYVIARGTDGVLWGKHKMNGGWNKLKHNVAQVSATSDPVNGLYVIARGTDGVLWGKHKMNGGWNKLKHNVAQVSATSDPVNGLYVIARGTDRVLWGKHKMNGGWNKLKHNVAQVSATSDPVNGLYVIARGTDRVLW